MTLDDLLADESIASIENTLTDMESVTSPYTEVRMTLETAHVVSFLARFGLDKARARRDRINGLACGPKTRRKKERTPARGQR